MFLQNNWTEKVMACCTDIEKNKVSNSAFLVGRICRGSIVFVLMKKIYIYTVLYRCIIYSTVHLKQAPETHVKHDSYFCCSSMIGSTPENHCKWKQWRNIKVKFFRQDFKLSNVKFDYVHFLCISGHRNDSLKAFCLELQGTSTQSA